MKLGQKQTLTIIKQVENGFILTDGSYEEAFIPEFFSENHWEEGAEIEVLVYQEDGELKATIEEPLCEAGEFAVMNCVQTLPSGAFVDWGIIKDLFVPYKEQKGKMEEGKKYLIYVYEDEETGLLTGTTKFKRRNIQHTDFHFAKGDKVDLIIMNQSELGWNVVIDKKYIGLVYQSDVYEKIYPLSEMKGYIKNIREDGKIDVTLQPEGFQNIDEYKQKILDKLEENFGLLHLSDKSSPEEIKEELQMSKKNFKKALGGLYKSKMVEILDGQIKLV